MNTYKLCKPLLEHDTETAQPILGAFESLSDTNRFTYADGENDHLKTIYYNVLNWTYNLPDMNEDSDAYKEIIELVEEIMDKLSPALQYTTRKILFD